LVNISVLIDASASRDVGTKKGSVILGDSKAFIEHEGLASTVQQWENGMRISPMLGTFEWWYLQGTFDDGSHAEFVFSAKPWMDNNGLLNPYLGLTITSPDGIQHRDIVRASTDQYQAARNTVNVTIGKNWVRGDLDTIQLHAESPKGFGADLVFNRTAPPTRFGGAGMWYFDPSLTQFSAAFDPMPDATVKGNLTYDGQTVQVQGDGYHDRQWGNVNWNQVLDRWFWTTGHFGNYTIDIGTQISSPFFNYQPVSTIYLAKGNQVLVESMKDVTVQGSGNLTNPRAAHDYPEVLNFHWQNGSNTVDLSLTNPEIVQAGSPVIISNATIFGNPEYLRLSGNATLNVNFNGSNETATGPAVWEVNYAR
jgi:predicted secreted hydrolase